MTLPTDPRPTPAPFPPAEPMPVRTPGEFPGHDTPQDQPIGRHSQDQLPANEFVVADENGEVDGFNADDYVYVNIGGKVRAIPKSSVEDEPETATQNIPKATMTEVVDPHFYAWLANGEVLRVKQSDLPAAAGTNAQFGHWQTDDGKVLQIVAVYPVEDKVKGETA